MDQDQLENKIIEFGFYQLTYEAGADIFGKRDGRLMDAIGSFSRSRQIMPFYDRRSRIYLLVDGRNYLGRTS